MIFWRRKKKPKSKTRVSKPPVSYQNKVSTAPIEKISKTKHKEIQEIKQKQEHIKKPAINKERNLSDDSKKEFIKVFNKLTTRHRAWDVWRDFIIMYACALSNAVDKSHYDEREKRYLKIIKKYNTQEQKLFPELAAQIVVALEKNPDQDFLGDIFMSLDLGSKTNGQYFTPYHISEFMSKIVINNDTVESARKEKGYVTINDCCCGGGAMLIAGINELRKQMAANNMNYQNHVLVIAQDIDETVALMCYIQLTLLGVAGYVKVGDSISEPIIENDDMKNYWFTMMYFTDIWVTRRLTHSLGEFTKEVKS